MWSHKALFAGVVMAASLQLPHAAFVGASYSSIRHQFPSLKKAGLQVQPMPTLAKATLTQVVPRSSPQMLSVTSVANEARGLLQLRGGELLSTMPTETLFNYLGAGLIMAVVALKVLVREGAPAGDAEEGKPVVPAGLRKLQLRFLLVFWLYKMADWLQGPYFYEVYASKIINGAAVSTDVVAKLFLTGFASTCIFGAFVGGMVDKVGRKRGSLAFAVFYILSALSTKSNLLWLLLLGRFAGGIGTSLLFSAPESWLVSQHMKEGLDGKFLSQTFGWAYFGDSIVAIIAGQLAGTVAGIRGPAGPFELSVGFLAAGAALVALLWQENKAEGAGAGDAEVEEASTGASVVEAEAPSTWARVQEAWKVMVADPKIMMVGAVQALFEGAMYIFVLNWPPSMKAVLPGGVPFGQVFSCFMVCCMLGSTLFSTLSSKGVAVERMVPVMLALGTGALATATLGLASLPLLIASFFVFEACVGMYFPAIGTLRSKYIPDEHRTTIMNIFGIPLNFIVVTVFLYIKRLGEVGCLACATTAITGALVAGVRLSQLTHQAALPPSDAPPDTLAQA